MADKFLDLVSGEQQLKDPIDSSAGAGDADKIIRTDSGGLIDASFMPSGVGEQIVLDASENLSTKSAVNIWDDSGTAKVRQANATDNTKPADGFVQAAVTSGNPATVIPVPTNVASVAGGGALTPAAKLYLSTTDGQVTETPPSTSGNVVQQLGIAITADDAFVICDRQKAVEIQ